MNLQSYINERMINEGIRSRDIDKALDRMAGVLDRGGVYSFKYTYPCKIDGQEKLGVPCFTDDNKGVLIVWNRDDHSSVEFVLFSKNFDEAMAGLTDDGLVKSTWDVEVLTKGASLVRICQMILDVCGGKVAMTRSALIDYLKNYQIWECEEGDQFPSMIIESDETVASLIKRRNNVYHKLRAARNRGKDYDSLQKEYDDLVNKIATARTDIKSNVKVIPIRDKEIEQLESQFENEVRATPEERFEDMESYIESTILGLRPGCIVSGAPGVGKTFRIMKALKQEGKIQGRDFGLIKGKCTTQNLYMMMHDYKNPGQVLVLDDADEIINDPVAINLIKAFTDSSDERIVSYGTSRPPKMDPEMAAACDDAVLTSGGEWVYPKEFEAKSSMIIITNMNAGQIDTAIRNRCLICDLSFNVDEILELVRSIAPKIKPDVIPMACKERALEYLQELADSNAPVEISIRSFTLVAGLYNTSAPEQAIRRRIREQMKLQSARGGKKY